jgi:hypothetical protein
MTIGRWSLAFAALALAALGGGGGPAPSGLSLSFREGSAADPHFTVTVSGLDAGTLDGLARHPELDGRVLAVFTVHDPNETYDPRAEPPPLLGTYRVDAAHGRLVFRSRFPAEPGVSYRAVYRPPSPVGEPLVSTFLVKDQTRTGVPTSVVRVAPSADILPENLLRFYVEFSAPMSRGEAYENVRLLDERGTPLELPFLELGEELWDPRGVRFTLLFDPGRIKTGLKPREELGPVLEAGKRYVLVIGRGWRDASGRRLAAEYRKPFRVGPPDTTPPDPSAWVVDPPGAGTRAPVTVRFPEPLDRAMLGRVLAVEAGQGRPVAGTVEVGRNETAWAFAPDEPWRLGDYHLRVDRALEDRAGNSVGRPFEVDVFRQVERTVSNGSVVVPFTVKAGAPR